MSTYELEQIRQVVREELDKRFTVSIPSVWQPGIYVCQHEWDYKPQSTATGYLRTCRKCGVSESAASTTGA